MNRYIDDEWVDDVDRDNTIDDDWVDDDRDDVVDDYWVDDDWIDDESLYNGRNVSKTYQIWIKIA